MSDWADAQKKAEANPHVLGAAPYIEREGMLQGERVGGAIVRRCWSRSFKVSRSTTR